MGTALILFAHGSSDAGWAAPFEELARRVRKALPEHEVRLAYLEAMQPSLSQAVAEAVAAGASTIHIAPIFLAAGGHIRRDLSALVRDLESRYPKVRIECSRPAGEDKQVLDSLADYCTRIVGG